MLLFAREASMTLLGLVLLKSSAVLVSAEADVAGPAASTVDCSLDSAVYLQLARGEGINTKLPQWFPYQWFLLVLAMMMGLGKGGVPGSSTSSVALNALYAPDGPGCMDASVALGVPVTVLADLAVVGNYVHKARWDIIVKLLPACGLGIAMGTQLMGKLSPAQAKLLIGSILCAILLLNLSQELLAKAGPKVQSKEEKERHGTRKTSHAPDVRGGCLCTHVYTPSFCWPRNTSVDISVRTDERLQCASEVQGKDKSEANDEDGAPAYAKTMWFTSIVGVIGGFATILTNSMGPMLNVFLLTLKLEPQVFVGTRATLFTVVNFLKIAQRIYLGSLKQDMLILGVKYGIVSVVGVFLSKMIVKRMSKSMFMKLEYTLMTYASLKLLDAGLALGFLN